jgi:hypothetical protein
MKNNISVILKISLLGMIFSFILAGCGSHALHEKPSINTTPITTMRTLIPTLFITPPVDKSQEPILIPTSSFNNGAVAMISQQDMTNDLFQEVVRNMVTKWLQGFEIDSTNKDAIKDYRIEKIILRNQPNDIHSEIIATVLFSVQVIDPQSNNWASVSVQEIKKNDPWRHVALTFDILPVDNNYELKVLFGYGT